MCQVLGVSKSGYYHWLAAKPSKRVLENKRIIACIRAIHTGSRQTYGSPRITIALKNAGIILSRPRVARLMRAAQIRGIACKKYRATTDSTHAYSRVPNVLDRHFQADKMGKIWVSDITFIPVGSQWLYLTAVIDLYDRKVVGWSTSTDMSAQNTTIKALKMALFNRKTNGLLLHSDQGVQYACEAFKTVLIEHGITQSMSRKGNCWDNAVAESFFKTLKVECTNRFAFKTFLEAKTELFNYVEGWYNRHRLHSSIGYVTPIQKQLTTKIHLA